MKEGPKIVTHFKDPIVCPFCGGNLLQELEASELEIEDSLWTIFHWQCLECEETFDKLAEDVFTGEYDEEAGGSRADN